MSLRKVTIRLLASGFFLVATLLVIMDVISVRDINTLSNLTKSMYRHPLTVSNAVLEVNAGIIAMHGYMKDVVLAQNAQDLQTAISKIDANEKRVFQHFEIVMDNFLGDKTRIVEARRTFSDWKVIRSEVIELILAGKYNEAVSITKGKGAVHLVLLTSQMEGLIDFAQNKASEFLANSESIHKKIVFELQMLVAVLLLLMGGIAIFVILKVNKMGKEIHKSEERYRIAIDGSSDGIWDWDIITDYDFFSPRWLEILGYDERDLEPTGKCFFSLVHPDDLATVKNNLDSHFQNDAPFDSEFRLLCKNGEYKWIQSRGQVLKNAQGEPQRMAGFISDISARKNADDELLKANTSLKMISKVNEALIHAVTEQQLLNDVIRIIINKGGFRMAWIGYSQNDVAKTVRPVAHYGYEHGYTETMEISWDEDNERGQGPTGSAIRLSTPIICHDIVNDETLAPWKDEAMERGYKSSVALPLLTDGEAIGVLNIYSSTANAFDDNNTSLLMELARDLAYGIGVLRAKENQLKYENELRWDVAVDQAMMEISRTILAGDVFIDDIAELILNQVRSLTRSQFGFVGYIDPVTGFLVCPTFTRDIWDQCKIEGKSAVFEKFTGLFGWVLNNKKSLLTNDPKRDHRSTGVPPGHVPIDKFLAVPVLVGDTLLGEIAIANPVAVYNDRDLHLMERVASFFALALQQIRSAAKIKDREQLFRRLFESAEVSIWNEDMSDVITELNQLRQDGVIDLRQYLEENEQVALNLANKVKVLQVNEATLKLFGAISDDEMLNKIGKTFGPGTIEVFIDELCAIWDKQDTFRAEAIFQTLSGDKINAIISFQIPKSEDDFKSVPVSIIDITERLEIEQQLWQSQKVEAVGNLAGGIAHDFNNLLLPIQALTDMTMKELPEDSRAFKRLEKVLAASEQAKKLVSQILSFSRKEETKIEKINIAQTIRNVMDLLRTTLPSTLNIKTQLKNVGDIMADPSQINAVLMNLASNSAFAMDGNVGNLSITLSRKTASRKDAALPLIDEGKNYCVLRVKDNGHGIEEKAIHRLFDPFYTTKGPGEGTGLGLSIVHGIIAKHGGAIRVNSKLNKGTTFEIFLPIVD